MEIKYKIEILETGQKHEFVLNFDDETYLYQPEVKENLPKWTELENGKCENCPIQGEPYCPAAVNIHDMVGRTKTNISHEEVKVFVVTKDRTIGKKTDLQSALFSLMGIVLSTSRCPHFKFLRPMGIFHLPFSNLEETMVRTIGFYLTQKYFDSVLNEEEQGQIELDGLKEKYASLETVNAGLAARINLAAKGDANKNAIVTLNLFAQMFSMAIRQDFSLIKKFFKY